MPDTGSVRGGSGEPWPEVVVHPDAESLALALATLFVEEARRAVRAHGGFRVALAGGSTPRWAYELLARPPFSELVPWADVDVFFGDERCVEPDDPRSNEHMAREALLDHVPLPAGRIHPMRCRGEGPGGGGGAGKGVAAEGAAGVGAGVAGALAAGVSGAGGALVPGLTGEGALPEVAARRAATEYEELLNAYFPRTKEERPPEAGSRPHAGAPLELGERGLDLVILGLGDNGHTASLFPGSDALWATERRVVAAFVDKEAGAGTTAAGEDLWRLTLTAPFINRAAVVVFVVSGSAKAQVVEEVLEGPPDPERLPAQLIKPRSGSLVWHLDEESAAHIRRRLTP
jgi:6-phosphogluconolactonase